MEPLTSFYHRYRLKFFLTLFSIIFFSSAAFTQGGELSGYVASESRVFPRSPLYLSQQGSGLSFSLQPEYYHEWGDGLQSFLIVPFFRYDQLDDERTHFDLREFYWQYLGDSWELKAGIRKIFWGVTESAHLVDVINQTDLVENLDGEQKLGQPMVDFLWIRDWGNLHFFLLPYFRERTFPGSDGRFRAPLSVDNGAAVYESDAEENHIDWAIYYTHTLGSFDLGLSYFNGTNREARLQPGSNDDGEDVLVPYYDLMQQTGLDLQYTNGGWLWKLEMISRIARDRGMFAAVGGFEYTFPNIRNSGIDLGIIGEYLFDDRRSQYFAPTPFQDDIFLGARLAFNDVQSSELLLGAITDRENGSTFLNLEASRRIGNNFKATVELRSFLNIDRNDALNSFRRDSYFRFELARFF